MPRVGHGSPRAIGEAGREARCGLVGEDLASAATNHQAATAQTFGSDGHLFDLGKQRRVVGGSAAVAGPSPIPGVALAHYCRHAVSDALAIARRTDLHGSLHHRFGAVAGTGPLEKFARARRPFEGNAGSYIDGHQT